MVDRFDPHDPHNILCENVRVSVLSVAASATAQFEGDEHELFQLKYSALMAGTMAAVACLMLSVTKERRRQKLKKALSVLSDHALEHALALDATEDQAGTA